MTFLLGHLPPRVHPVIWARADPALPLARLRARGELVELRAADLRFTPDGVAAHLNDAAALNLTTGDGRTSRASSPDSRATTCTSSTAWSKRSWDARAMLEVLDRPTRSSSGSTTGAAGDHRTGARGRPRRDVPARPVLHALRRRAAVPVSAGAPVHPRHGPGRSPAAAAMTEQA
ncbi:hypothetical protein F8144_25985 [Streptomyces triticiradicis]|uniref:Uncharacterized protein n=1 Tax=Streptomyces triticiradicis TaxID=2651189 RepID=A0A7J5DAF1_9ACTN|nr:hypothetical protein F8144_25985 [Streptomyces triticiradicis]